MLQVLASDSPIQQPLSEHLRDPCLEVSENGRTLDQKRFAMTLIWEMTIWRGQRSRLLSKCRALLDDMLNGLDVTSQRTVGGGGESLKDGVDKEAR